MEFIFTAGSIGYLKILRAFWERVFRGTTEGDLVVVLVRKMEATQLIGSAHSASVTGLEFSKHGRYT